MFAATLSGITVLDGTNTGAKGFNVLEAMQKPRWYTADVLSSDFSETGPLSAIPARVTTPATA